MRIPLLALCGSIFVAGFGSSAEPAKDTSAAAFLRTKKLKGKVTVELKNAPLKDILLDISNQLQDLKLGPISAAYDTGISGNTKATLEVKNVPAEEALDALFKSMDLGYIVVSKDKDRQDGWIKIVKGNARGWEPGTEPKDAPKPKTEDKPEVKKPDDKKPETPEDPDEKAAQTKLEAAKKLLADQKPDEAKSLLKYAVRFFPKTKAAEEAKKLLDENK